MFIDGLKGLLPVLVTKYLEVKLNLIQEYHLLPVLSAVSVIIGHSKSIFLGFTGGKSVAAGIGGIIGLCWPVGLITVGIWTVMTYFTKIVSISSITVVMLTPVWMLMLNQPLSYIIYCFIGALYISWLHRENVKRLLAGNENKIRN
jgi:glycerol-3-phosphate acyltransferase PlsY